MFFNMDKKTLYAVLGILAVISIISLGADGIMGLLLTLPGVILAITFHEFAHAYAADKLGDTTPRSQGRLTLDPGAHIDPFGILLLIFAHIGWGKPVEINPNNFNSNKSKATCEMWVSLAGPLMNFFLALVLTVIFFFIGIFIPKSNIIGIINTTIYYAITVNIGLGVFNLIPIPPLDGEKIFRRFLPYNAINWLDRNEQTLYFIFMILWITGVLGKLVSPVIGIIYNLMFTVVGLVFGIFV